MASRRPASLMAIVIASCGAGCAADDPGGRPGPRPPGDPTGAGLHPALRPGDLALGQQIVTRMEGLLPSRRLIRRIRAGHVGGVILFADNVRSGPQVRRLVHRLQSAAAERHRPPLLVMADQEGGDVKRLPFAPPWLSAAQMGRSRSPASTALAQGRATGRALRGYGINVDLAPVVDVAGASPTLGARTFGGDPGRVAEAGCAFARGLRHAGVAPTLKHFPGFGAARLNTDDAPVSIDLAASRLRSALTPYRRCARGQALVMVSSAIYPHLTGREPAMLARALYARELPAVGFHGLTISDDLEAPALASERAVSRRAVAAGLDLLLYALHESRSAHEYRRLLGDLRAGRLSKRRVLAADARIRAFKRRLVADRRR